MSEPDLVGPDPVRPAPVGTRSRPLAYAGLAVGGLGGLVASGQVWSRGEAGTTAVTFTGTEVTAGLSQAVPILLLVGAVLSLALRVTGRRVVGGLLGLLALAGAVGTLLDHRPDADQLTAKLTAVTLGDSVGVHQTAWPWLHLVCCLIGLVGAVALAGWAGRWPTRAARFERTTADAGGIDPAHDDPAVVWKAIDAGIDPTEDPASDEGPHADPSAPIGSTRSTGATMGTSAPRPAQTGPARSEPAVGAEPDQTESFPDQVAGDRPRRRDSDGSPA